MPRNLDRRVEILFPVEDEKLKARICHILEVQLADNVKAQYLRPDGTYAKRNRRGKEPICAQDTFCAEAVQAAKEAGKKQDSGGDESVYSAGTIKKLQFADKQNSPKM